ncbi:MAG TPA: ANTAR domain-containing protein [Streptosporangiaceae bacterium]|nr:ANTAR domain-containing protein [Streptosporangiaceae bacterium]
MPDQGAPEVGQVPGAEPAEAAASAAEFAGEPSSTASGGQLAAAPEAVVRRTADGWRVGDDELPDLTCAMVLADLIAAELPTDIQPAVPAAPAAAARDEPVAEEARRLRTTIGQLEHALTARIRIEQAIGVLAERHRIRPRQAFEQLRTAARNRGRKVIDIATDVVASASNPLLQLPEELSRQRAAPRHAARNPRRVLRSE